MSALPVERRALGFAMRQAEQVGLIQPPRELTALAAATGYASEEIDLVFELMVTPEERTVGGTASLPELDGQIVGQLVLSDLVEIGDRGDWVLTEKGRVMAALLDEYADSKYCWKTAK